MYSASESKYFHLQLCRPVTLQAERRQHSPPLSTCQMRKFRGDLVAASFCSLQRQGMNKWKKGLQSTHHEKLTTARENNFYFGPLEYSLRSDAKLLSSSSRVRNRMPIYQPWCHGTITRSQAEDLLSKAARDGSFLIRASESIKGAYALCVL